MLFGAIDVGTNSIHLIVVEFDSTFDTTRVVYKDREMVRLGSNDAMEHGRLSAKAMARGVEAIVRFVDAARIDAEQHLARNDVGLVWKDGQMADGQHAVADRARSGLESKYFRAS